MHHSEEDMYENKFAILSFFIFFLSKMLSLGLSLPGGPGDTKDNAYEIWDKIHWIEFGDSLYSDEYKPLIDRWHIDKYFSLMQDINDINVPIGSIDAYLYSDGKKIDVVMDYTGLFTSVLLSGIERTVYGLILDGYLSGWGVGGIISGLASRYGRPPPTATHCINNATLVSINPYNGNVGGIANSNYGTISHCLNNGSVTGVDMVAGIAATNLGYILNSINTGKVTASISEPNALDWWNYQGAAGISVLHQGNLSNCINLGDIVGYDYVSGIVSAAYSGGYMVIVTNSINAGYIKGNKYVGSILGYGNIHITNCINTGVVEGMEDVGAIVGKE